MLRALTSFTEQDLDQIFNIQKENYQESLKLAQRAIFFGLLIAGIAHYLPYASEGAQLPKLPFLSVEFTSLETLQITLLVLYLGSGFLAWFAMRNAYQNLTEIKDRNLAIAVSKYPCLAVTNFWFGGILAGALLSIGAMLLMSIYEFNNIYQKLLYIIAALPYWSTLRLGGMINSWESRRDN